MIDRGHLNTNSREIVYFIRNVSFKKAVFDYDVSYVALAIRIVRKAH